jgi:uncharacterized protein (UPF0276 family)
MSASTDTVSLPWMGLGLSSNLDAGEQPNPYRVAERAPGSFDFVEYSAPLELERTQAEATLWPTLAAQRPSIPVLFHPVHLNLWGPTLQSDASLEALEAHAREVQTPWVGNDVGWWHGGGTGFPGYLFIPPPLNAQGLAQSITHARHVQAALSVPLALENPPVLTKRGDRHVLDFMAQLHAATGAPLILDLGHLLSFQLAAGLAPDAGLSDFPLEAVIEVHVAGGVIHQRGDRRFYVDDHTQPVREELFELLEAWLPKLPNLRALTFEGDGHRIELFSRVHAGEDGDDPEGAREEQAFRMAVLAQEVDLHFPLTRRLIAPAIEGLSAFSASPFYREVFTEPGRELDGAFARWARSELSQPGKEAGAVVLAFEFAAQHLAGAPPPAPGEGEIGVSPDARYMHFPVDLTELVESARALDVHLDARARTGGRHEVSALEALWQVVRRAPERHWRLALERVGPRFRRVLVDPQEADALEAAAALLPLSRLEEVAPADVWRSLRRRGWLRLASERRR